MSKEPDAQAYMDLCFVLSRVGADLDEALPKIQDGEQYSLLIAAKRLVSDVLRQESEAYMEQTRSEG